MDLKPLRAERGEGKVRTAWRSSGVCARHLAVVVVVVVVIFLPGNKSTDRKACLPRTRLDKSSKYTHTVFLLTLLYLALPKRHQNKRYLALDPVSSLPLPSFYPHICC